MHTSRRRHRHATSQRSVSKLELAIFSVGLILSVVAGVVAYQIVGLYGDGAFSIGYRRHIQDPETGRMLLVHETRTPTGVVRRIFDGATLKEVDLDLDANGNPHKRAHVSGEKVTVVERDTNGDGHTDSWEYYDAQGRLLKVGFSMANDGVVNAWAYRDKNNQVAKVEVSTRRDGVIDRWEYYEKNQLARVEEDKNHDGRVDHWYTYDGGILMSTSTTPPAR